MMRTSRWFGSILISCAMGAVAIAQAPRLNVKMGLWELTSTTDMGGMQMPQMPDMSKMPPEQRARMEAMMKNRMGGRTTTTKTCMTKEKFDKSGFMAQDRNSNCTQTLVSDSTSALESKVVCTGEHPMTGDVRFEALSPTSVKGTVKSTSAQKDGPLTINIAMEGKWLGADCGDVK